MKSMDRDELFEQFKELFTLKKELDGKIKLFKKENDYTSISKNLTKAKEDLYNYMVENNIDNIGGLTSDDLEPNKIKKIERLEKKKEKISSVLTPYLQDENKCDEASEKIIELC